MGDEEVMITTTGNEANEEASDQENYYVPSTQSTPNIIGNAGDMEEEQEDMTPQLVND